MPLNDHHVEGQPLANPTPGPPDREMAHGWYLPGTVIVASSVVGMGLSVVVAPWLSLVTAVGLAFALYLAIKATIRGKKSNERVWAHWVSFALGIFSYVPVMIIATVLIGIYAFNTTDSGASSSTETSVAPDESLSLPGDSVHRLTSNKPDFNSVTVISAMPASATVPMVSLEASARLIKARATSLGVNPRVFIIGPNGIEVDIDAEEQGSMGLDTIVETLFADNSSGTDPMPLPLAVMSIRGVDRVRPTQDVSVPVAGTLAQGIQVTGVANEASAAAVGDALGGAGEEGYYGVDYPDRSPGPRDLLVRFPGITGSVADLNTPLGSEIDRVFLQAGDLQREALTFVHYREIL